MPLPLHQGKAAFYTSKVLLKYSLEANALNWGATFWYLRMVLSLYAFNDSFEFLAHFFGYGF
ncbi:hypothetical protein POKO110462_13175 [Pontibacter korlensis]